MEINRSHFDLALERFREGYIFNFRGIDLRLTPDNILEISIQSSWQIGNTTKVTALLGFHLANHVTDTLIKESPKLQV